MAPGRSPDRPLEPPRPSNEVLGGHPCRLTEAAWATGHTARLGDRRRPIGSDDPNRRLPRTPVLRAFGAACSCNELAILARRWLCAGSFTAWAFATASTARRYVASGGAPTLCLVQRGLRSSSTAAFGMGAQSTGAEGHQSTAGTGRARSNATATATPTLIDAWPPPGG